MTALRLRGVFPMVVTPFCADGAVSSAEIERVVHFLLERGCAGVSALGLGAEVSTLSGEERRLITRVVVDAAAEQPVIVGCSSPDTRESIALARHAADAGAAAIMVAPPPRPELSRVELASHYAAVADAVAPVPVMVQDAPSFVGVALDAGFVADLRHGHDNVLYAKPESLPALERTAELVALYGIEVFAGYGALYLLDALRAGAAGVIPGCEAPGQIAEIVGDFEAGRLDDAEQRFARILPLLVTEFQSLDYFVACTKILLVELGVIGRPDLRGKSPVSTRGRQLLVERARRAGVLAGS